MIAFILIIQKAVSKLTKHIYSQSSELNIMNAQISESQKVLVSVMTQYNKITSDISELNTKLTSIHQELSLLSSDYSDNQQVAQAIELARKGSSPQIIVEQTGLSTEDADAIVRFHGENESS
jgi:septal ring factor EnvC (AmiA/AmiB activator)